MDVIVTEDLIGSEDEAEVTEWIVSDGRLVAEGDPIAMLETSKVQLQLDSPAGGVITLLVAEGTVVGPNSVIARVVQS